MLHAVKAGRGQLALGGVLRDICDRNAETTRETNFGTGVASHGLLLWVGHLVTAKDAGRIRDKENESTDLGPACKQCSGGRVDGFVLVPGFHSP